MCTLIGKRTSRKLVIIGNTPCCLAVEQIEVINPKYSRDNGWEEILVDDIVGDLPEWTHWTHYQPNRRLPADLPLTTSEGQQIVWIDMDEDVRRHVPEDPIGSISHKGHTLHFRDWERVHVLHSYVCDTLRKPGSYPGNELYLRMIPAVFLGKSARKKVAIKLKKLLESRGSCS